MQTKREEDALNAQINEMGIYNGHQSEPTTPPEYRDGVFPTALSRPNRYSASITSPTNGQPPFLNRSNRSSSHALPYQSSHNSSKFSSKSVSNSRRNSDEEEEEYDYELPPVPQAGVA